MILEDLIQRLPDGDFEGAERTAWEIAAGAGTSRDAKRDDADGQRLFDVADDLLTWIWELAEPELARVALLAELYGRLPSTSVLFGIAVHLYRHMTAAARAELWLLLRRYLDSQDERLADPISYYLWCEWFEDSERQIVEEVWRCLVDDQPTDRALRRVLESSGPVPVDLKDELVARVIDDVDWHRSIFLALVDSRLAVYGKWDAVWADKVFVRLRTPEAVGGSVETAIELYATRGANGS